MTFKVVKQLNPIVPMKTCTKPNYNLYMEERLKILKNICDKRVMVMKKNSKIYGPCQSKTTFCQFCLSTYDPVFLQVIYLGD